MSFKEFDELEEFEPNKRNKKNPKHGAMPCLDHGENVLFVCDYFSSDTFYDMYTHKIALIATQSVGKGPNLQNIF